MPVSGKFRSKKNSSDEFIELLYYNGGSIEILGKFGDSWFKKEGFDMLYNPADDNLHFVGYNRFMENGNPQTNIEFMPYADGIFDYDIKDNDDFATMSSGICGGFDHMLGGSRCGGPQSFTIEGIQSSDGPTVCIF